MDDILLLGVLAWIALVTSGGFVPLELKHHLDSFCLAEESMRPLLLSMVATLRREMNVFMETFLEVFGLLLILHPLILGSFRITV